MLWQRMKIISGLICRGSKVIKSNQFRFNLAERLQLIFGIFAKANLSAKMDRERGIVLADE
jgi:hypothetical protein